MGIRNKVTGEMYTITSYNPTTGNITGINNTTGNSDLGNVSNIYIGGGNPGEVLSTDGTGNLSWIPDGGGANTGNVTFDDQIVIGTGDEFGGGGLYLAMGPTSAANLQYLRVRGGDYPTHVHLDTGNNQFFDQYFGADARFVKLEAAGNIVVNADDYAGNAATWTFDTSGKVTVPGAIVSAFGNLHLQPDPTNTDAYLDIFLTAGPEIHIAGNGETVVLGTDDFANVTVNVNGNVSIQANAGTPYTWTFGTDSNLTLPLGSTINNAPNIVTVTLDQFTDGGYPGTQVFYKVSDTLYELSPGGPYMTLISGIWYLKISVSTYYNSTDLITWETVAGGLPAPIGSPTAIVTMNLGVGGNVWNFDGNGNLTLPGNTFSVNYANGAQVLLDDTQSQIANGNSNVSVPTSNDNVYINVNGGTQKQWIFDTDGNLRTPGNVDIYGAINFPQQVSSINWSTYNIELSQYGRINTNVDFFANANVIGAQYLKGDGSNISNIAGANVTGEVALANTVSNPAQPNITSVGVLTSLTTGGLTIEGLLTANANAQFNQDVYFAGNVTLPGNINQISGNSASFFGDPATGFGALYVGLPTGYTLLDNEVAQFSDNFNGYTQVTHRNINGGDQATGDFVITADNGTDLVNHIDLGIAGSGYDGTLANNSLGTALYPNDGYLYTRGNVTGGNLILGSNQTNGVVRIIANGASNIGDTVATFAANGLTVASNVAASYFLGNGSQLTSIANGSNTQIQFNNDGNLAASANLTFSDSVAGGVVEVGTELTLLGNGTIGTSGSDLLLQPAGNLVAEVAGNDWTFDSTGNLTIPGSSGGLIKTVANASIGIVAMDNGTDNPAQLMSWNVGGGAPTSIISAYSTNATIQTNAAASINTWQFLANAVTVFPGDLIGSGASPAPSINGFDSASFSGNVTADYFIGNGSQLTGMYGNTNVAAYLPGYTGQLNRVTIITASGNIDTNANINVTGNIYATYVLGNGSQLTDLPAPVVTQDITSVGDMSIMTYDGNIKYVNNATIEPATGDIASAGNIVATGNVQGAYVLGNGSLLTNLPQPVPAIGTMTSGANITPTTSVTQYNVTALAVASNVDAPTGTPADGQKLTIRILDNGTPQALTWNAIYQVIGTTLPTTTVANKYVYVGCIYNAQETTWDCVSVAQQA